MPSLNEMSSVYSNEVQIFGGPFDMVLEFHERTPEERIAKGVEGNYSVVARLVMSQSHAKSMLPLLAKVIADYETAFGPIPAPGFGDSARP
mgnify:CR=1 FL=1